MLCDGLGQLKALWPKEGLFGASFVNVGMFKKTQCKFYAQNSTDAFIDFRLWHGARTHELCKLIVIQAARHIHVDPGKEGLSRRGRVIGGDSVCYQFAD